MVQGCRLNLDQTVRTNFITSRQLGFVSSIPMTLLSIDAANVWPSTLNVLSDDSRHTRVKLHLPKYTTNRVNVKRKT